MKMAVNLQSKSAADRVKAAHSSVVMTGHQHPLSHARALKLFPEANKVIDKDTHC